jgi:hypothetical protein
MRADDLGVFKDDQEFVQGPFAGNSDAVVEAGM